MKKLYLLLLGAMMTLTASAQGDTQRMVVWLKGNQKVYHELSDKPETSFSDGLLWLKTDKVSVSYPLTDVLRYTFEGPMTAIDSPSVRPGELRFMEGKDAMAFDGLPEGTTLELYSLDGKKLSTVKALNGQRTVVSLANHPAGTYIVKMGNTSFKLIKP